MNDNLTITAIVIPLGLAMLFVGGFILDSLLTKMHIEAMSQKGYCQKYIPEQKTIIWEKCKG